MSLSFYESVRNDAVAGQAVNFVYALGTHEGEDVLIVAISALPCPPVAGDFFYATDDVLFEVMDSPTALAPYVIDGANYKVFVSAA